MSIPSFAREEFSSLGTLAYFDTPTQGVASSRGVAALRDAIAGWESGTADWQAWEGEAEATRIAFAALLGCAPTDVGLINSVVTAASTVATQLPPGRILVADQEYRSNLLPWLAQREFGRDVEVVSGEISTEKLVDALDDRTCLVAMSSVQSANGARVDLEAIVEAAHASGAVVFVDATQSLGAIRLPVASSGVDFVAAAGYKWLLGGRGTGYFYVRPDHQDDLVPVLASPASASDVLEGQYYGTPYTPFDDARRFDQSPAWLSWVAARPAMELLVDVGMSALEQHALNLAAQFREGCRELGYGEALSTTDLPSPIVTVDLSEPERVRQELAQRDIAVAVRGGGIRVGFHLYNDESHLDRLLDGLARAWR